MLVFSRREQEQAVITVPPSTEPRQIVVTLVEIRGDKARLGFIADRDVVIHRREVQDVIDADLASAEKWADEIKAS